MAFNSLGNMRIGGSLFGSPPAKQSQKTFLPKTSAPYSAKTATTGSGQVRRISVQNGTLPSGTAATTATGRTGTAYQPSATTGENAGLYNRLEGLGDVWSQLTPEERDVYLRTGVVPSSAIDLISGVRAPASSMPSWGRPGDESAMTADSQNTVYDSAGAPIGQMVQGTDGTWSYAPTMMDDATVNTEVWGGQAPTLVADPQTGIPTYDFGTGTVGATSFSVLQQAADSVGMTPEQFVSAAFGIDPSTPGGLPGIITQWFREQSYQQGGVQQALYAWNNYVGSAAQSLQSTLGTTGTTAQPANTQITNAADMGISQEALLSLLGYDPTITADLAAATGDTSASTDATGALTRDFENARTFYY